MDKAVVEKLVETHGFTDFKWIRGEDIAVGQWVRFKCRLMCSTYGTKPVCPPNMPPIPECERFFKEYDHALIIRIAKKAHHRDADSEKFKILDDDLLSLEKALFYKGYHKVMALPATICSRCESCAVTAENCHQKDKARPTPEALGVDVFGTVRKIGYPVEVLSSYEQQMNRYIFVMVQ